MPAEVVSTVMPSGGDYSSLSAWEAGEQRNLVTADEIAIAECYTMIDAGGLTVSGWTPDATRKIIVRAAPGHENNGIDGQGFVLDRASGSTLQIKENYTEIYGINPRAATGTSRALYFYRADNCIVDGCFIDGEGATRQAAWNRESDNVVVRNSIIANAATQGIETTVSGNMSVENCLVINAGGWGIKGLSNTSQAKNCTVKNCGTGSYHSSIASGSANNAADDASTVTPPGLNPILTDIVDADFTDAANDDYSLAPGSTLIDAGADLSADFTTDITGAVRSLPFDVGPFEYVAAGNAPVMASALVAA